MPAGLMLGLDHFHKDTITPLCSGFMSCHCCFPRDGPRPVQGNTDPRIWDTPSGSRQARLKLAVQGSSRGPGADPTRQPSRCAHPDPISLSKESTQIFFVLLYAT